MKKWFCNHEGCSTKLAASNFYGVCPAHNGKTCVFEGCDASLRRDNSSGYCQSHWPFSEQGKESARIKTLRWTANNPNRDRTSSRLSASRWQRNNPDKVKIREHRRRARKLNAFVENVDPSCVWNRDAGLCFLCGFPADKDSWHLAHIVPLVRGGEHSYSNTAVSHPRCNLKQGSKLMEELNLDDWFEELEEVG